MHFLSFSTFFLYTLYSIGLGVALCGKDKKKRYNSPYLLAIIINIVMLIFEVSCENIFTVGGDGGS